MRKKAGFRALVAGLVVLFVLFAGCSGDTTPTTTPVGPKFVALQAGFKDKIML